MVPRQFGGGLMGRRAAFQVGSVQGALRGGENGEFYLIGRRAEGRMMCNDTGKANGSEFVVWTESENGVEMMDWGARLLHVPRGIDGTGRLKPWSAG